MSYSILISWRGVGKTVIFWAGPCFFTWGERGEGGMVCCILVFFLSHLEIKSTVLLILLPRL